MIACSDQYEDELYASLKQLSVYFQTQLKDLRSQIVREACISIAYLSQSFKNRLDTFAEVCMPHLINLIQNSAKVMASSGIVAIRFIIEVCYLIFSMCKNLFNFEKNSFLILFKLSNLEA